MDLPQRDFTKKNQEENGSAGIKHAPDGLRALQLNLSANTSYTVEGVVALSDALKAQPSVTEVR